MSLRCPECGFRIGHLEVLKFLRLHSIYCRQCNSPLSMDGRGRAAIIISLLASFLIGWFIMVATGYEYSLFIAFVMGFVIGSIAGANFGRLFISEEKREGKNS